MIWDLADGKPVHRLQPYAGEDVASTCFSPQGDRLLTAGGDVRLWDVPTGTEVLRFSDDESDSYDAAAFSADGRQIIARDSTAIWVRRIR